MNFMRKKPASPTDDLTALYNEVANRTIHTLALEQKGDYKRAVQGWKGLHTHVLYQMDTINQTHGQHNYSADELYLREGIEMLLSKGLDHLDRVSKLYQESVEPEEKPANVSSSTYTVPTLRNNSTPMGFSARNQQHHDQQSQKPRMLKTLRTEKPNKFMLNNNRSTPQEISKIAAGAIYNHGQSSQEKLQNWAPSKSLSALNVKDSRKSEDLNIFDESFDDDFDYQSIKRNEALSQLEASGKSSRSHRRNVSENNNLATNFESLQILSGSPSPVRQGSPHRMSNLAVPNSSFNSLSVSDSDFGSPVNSSSSLVENPAASRPPIPKTVPLLSPSISKPNKTFLASTTRKTTPRPTPKPTITTSAHQTLRKTIPPKTSTTTTTTSGKAPLRQVRTPPTPKATPIATASSIAARKTAERAKIVTTKRPPVKASLEAKRPAPQKPGKPASTIRPPTKATNTIRKASTPATTRSKPPVAAAPTTSSRSRSESPKRANVTKDTETISDSSSTEGDVDETQLSEKEVEEKMQQQIIDEIRGIDPGAAKQIFNEIVVKGDEVHWDDIAGLDTAKNSLKEAVVYPFLRPDLFSGLREPARGMLLFGPPGTGKTMLARAVATESKSTFFSISASSLTSKFLGESEKLVRALFLLARKLAPSIIFVDEIDSLLSARNESGEHESSRRIKNEFLIQWSELTHAAAGRDQGDDLQRVLVLAATNLPWAIDEAARRRFVRRQYIPLPEPETRLAHLENLMAHQKHTLSEKDKNKLIELTDGFSGSDLTALAKDAAMGPLRSLGDKLLSTSRDEIRPIGLDDFVNSLKYIKPSVSKENLKDFDDWAGKFGSSGV